MTTRVEWLARLNVSMNIANSPLMKTDAQRELEMSKILEIFHEGSKRDWVSPELGDKVMTFLLSQGELERVKNILIPFQQEIQRLMANAPNYPNQTQIRTNNPYSWVGAKIEWCSDSDYVAPSSATASLGPRR